MSFFTRLLVFLHLREAPAIFETTALTDAWEFTTPEGLVITNVRITVRAGNLLPESRFEVEGVWTELPS